MVSTRSPKSPGVLTRKKSATDLSKGRPKRNVSPKNLEDSVTGLSWREERELKKALYMSLQESRRASRDDKSDDLDFVYVGGEGHSSLSECIRKEIGHVKTWKSTEKNSTHDSGKSNSDEKERELKRTKFHAQRKFAVNSFSTLHSSESVGLGVNGRALSVVNEAKKVHAQRKFAQGYVPSAPSETMSKPKLKMSPVKLFPVRPKTEDFLTYLCFRGTPLLPPHLDLMNITKEEYDSDMVNGKNCTRESSPASSSTLSHNNEDSMDVPDVLNKTPLKKAARASASTPDTARGFSHLRHKVDRKGSLSSRSSSASSHHRKRLSDSYLTSHSGSSRSPLKSDRLSLKRKALATLASSSKLRKSKSTVSDGDLRRKKVPAYIKGSRASVKHSKGASQTLIQEPSKRGLVTVSSFNVTDSQLLHKWSCDKVIDSVTHKTDHYVGKAGLDTEASCPMAEDSGIYELDQGSKEAFGNQLCSTFDDFNHERCLETYLNVKQSNTYSIGQVRTHYTKSTGISDFKSSTIDNSCDGTDTQVTAEFKQSKNVTGLSSNLVDSLLTPLSSDLDESLDICLDGDISLNISLDVNEVFGIADTDSPAYSIGDKCRSDTDIYGFLQEADKHQPEDNSDVNINLEYFRPAFNHPLLSPPISERKTIQVKNEKEDQKEHFEMFEHNYSKVMKVVRFKVKSNVKLAGSRLCSTPCEPFRNGRICTPELPSYLQNERVKPAREKRSSINRGDHQRKRKSTSDLPDRTQGHHSLLKRSRLSMSTRSRSTDKLNSKIKQTSRKTHTKRQSSGLETHPKKRFAVTKDKVKKTFKPHRPVTRAASHMKSALKAAKLAASKKLRMVKKSDPGPSGAKKEKVLDKGKRLMKQKSTVSPEKRTTDEKAISSSSLGSDHSGELRVKTEQFPHDGDIPCVVQCPTYYPSEEQFKDPILYIQGLEEEASQYGMCKIVPPCSWKMESRELEDFRFPTSIQYIHKLLQKWSPITEQLELIKALNKNNGNEIVHMPQIGGVDIDLVRLYELVQKHGGMKGTVGKEKKWMKIADTMKIPKQSDRVSKLYAAYCKYLLSYETLSDEETEKLLDSVRAERQKQTGNKGCPSCEKCVFKGKAQPLSSFHRAARNTQTLYGRENCNHKPDDVEIDYWETVEKSDDHVSVQSASLDTSVYGSMFPVRRDNPYARHGWNLHNLVESKGSILHHLGLIAGITVPTLNIGMLYSTKCLGCNGHNLPTVQYLHEGPGLVWYAVPKQEKEKLKSALRKLLPHHTRDKGFITEHDSVMIPPFKLTERGVPMSRCVQSGKEFVVVFSSVYYSNISLGYNLSESVQYGTQDWIPYGCQAAKDLSLNNDVELFSMDAMLIFLARETTTPTNTLSILLPYLEKLVEREVVERKKLFEAGLKETERLHDKLNKPTQKTEVLEEIIICDNSNKICYLSMVLNTNENSAFSLEQGLLHIQKRKNLKNCKLMYRYSEEELNALLKDVKQRLKLGTSSSPNTSSPKRKPVRKTESKYAVSPP